MPKTRKHSFDRDGDGTFKRACAAVIHDHTILNSGSLISIKKGKKLKKNTLEYLYERNIIPRRAKHICDRCLEEVERNVITPDIAVPGTSKEADNIETNSDDKRCSDFQLCIETGKLLSGHIDSDIAKLYNTKDKCSLANLLGYNPNEWLQERPKALVGLLRELCGFQENYSVDKQLKVAKCIELIYGCRNSKLVLPLSFKENLLMYSVSRNKQLLTYNSKLAPSGSTDTISKWLAEQASAPVEFPRGMVRTVFDNEQVIGKTHKVKANNKVPSSIVTSHMYISMDPDSTMQKDASFSPQKWLFADPNEIQKTYFLEDKAINMDNFRITRDEFIKRRLVSVVEEHDLEGRDIIDEIMAKKCESCKEKVCFDCGAQNEYSCRKCTNCGGQLTYEKPDLSQLMDRKSEMKPYGSFITVLTEENKFTVKTGEPDLCNPGSFENVAQILSNISVRANVGEEVTNDRKWLFLECDGGIYSLVEKLIFNVHFCKRCSESFYGLESFTDHRCHILHDIEPEHRFGWILPLPGLLLLEMNACKVFFELTWDVILKDICSKLGYSSPKALEFAKKCGDHHKSWKVLEIVYLAIADELLVPYVRKCLSDKSEPSVDGYWIWAAEIADPNYMFLQQMVFTFLHSLMLFRIGCRRGNADAIYAGRDKMSLMFFARHHPSCQRIVTLNRYIEAMMPEDLRKIVASSLTLSRTGNHGHYQGGDACLEEINKEAKRWIGPKGMNGR